ncbi:hypothetical protein [Marinobacter sp.]|uniref:hypothetical protein n=1 Tax=Marinobacter sp. TaxID=50741 RepID=UPI00260E6A38|nr:hypothetical protein [Marinobacter sp.]
MESKEFDESCVDQFASAMKRKLAKKREEGRGGWSNKEDCPKDRLIKMMSDQFDKGDPINVANFAMMLWARGEGTAYSKDQSPEQAYACPECRSDMTPSDEADRELKPWYCHECGFNEPEALP